MNQGDTLIHIDVQADPLIAIEIRELVRETFAYMPPWKMVGNAIFAPSDARFFAFNLSSYDFIWLRSNESYDDTMDEENTYVIRNTADISWLLEFIALNNASLRTPTGLNLSKIKKKLEEFDKQNNSKKRKEKKTPKSSWPKTSKDLMDALVAIQPMDMPSGKVFYMDYVNSMGIPPQYVEKEDFAAKAKEIAKLKAKAIKSGQAIVMGSQVSFDEVTKKMAEEVAAEIDAQIMEKMAQILAESEPTNNATVAYPWQKMSWGMMAEAQAAMAHDMAEHEKAKMAKYAYKKFNPEYYGKITIQPDSPYPKMDY